MKVSILRSAAILAMMIPLCASARPLVEPFTYYANGHDLKTVLAGFARAQGMKADVEPDVKGRVSGRFTKVAWAITRSVTRCAFTSSIRRRRNS